MAKNTSSLKVAARRSIALRADGCDGGTTRRLFRNADKNVGVARAGPVIKLGRTDKLDLAAPTSAHFPPPLLSTGLHLAVFRMNFDEEETNERT